MNNERLNNAKWIFERQLNWIATADVKVGVVVSLHVAMLGGLGAAYSVASSKSTWVNIMAFGYVLCALFALVCAALALWPRTRGPIQSLIFFVRVAEIRCEDYVDAFCSQNDDNFLKDITTQIHRNAEIARDKYSNVGKAMMASFVGSIPWVTAIGLLVMPK
jgi:hypothetical protein